jgi:ubiquinone/menaquinone biosynthesis C-methylase UbiE
MSASRGADQGGIVRPQSSRRLFQPHLVTSHYNTIGRTYSRGRQSDPRIATAIESALGNCETILNVGAGTGSYEPRSRMVVAVEPSITMIAQRPAGAAPVVQACAEALPFRNASFDAVLGILTVHHWKDQAKGFSECVRLARSRVVFVTNDFDVCAKFWLFDYFPELLRADRHIFPRMARFVGALGPVETIAVPVPSDCRDGFLGAYWQRPRAYLDPIVRGNISTFSKIGNIDSQLARLKGDIESGAWQRRYPSLEGLGTLDLGYRIVIARRDGGG